MGKDVEIVSETKRIRPAKSEVRRLMADASKAAKLLKWNPAISLEEGLKRTIEQIKLKEEIYKTKIYNV